MKTVYFIFLLIFPLAIFSQKYVLIDKDLVRPLIQTDTPKFVNLNKGYAVFSRNDIDTVLKTLNIIDRYLNETDRSKNKTIYIQFNKTAIIGEREHYSYGDRYDINMYSFLGDFSSKFIISNSRLSNKANSKRIDQMIKYFAPLRISD